MTVQARKLRTMDDVPLDGKRVLVRVDFNVTVGEDGIVDASEDFRIEAALPTIQELQQRRCKVILLTHRGRLGEGQEAVDLSPIHRRLEDLLRDDVRQLHHLYGDDVETAIIAMEPGSAALLPNVRTDEREGIGNEKFAQELATFVDGYVNECFSVCHRAHTSVAFLPRLLPSVAGRHTVREVEALSTLLHRPEHPYVAIISGAKVATKIGMLRQLLTHVDTLCLGGRIANVFLAARQGTSVEHYGANDIAAAMSLLETAADKILLPSDVVIGPPDGRADVRTISAADIPPGEKNIFDIGPAAAENIIQACRSAKTVMWNGPVGFQEVDAYAKATQTIAEGLASLSAYRVVGGGDTVNALEKYRVADKYDHVSAGGGAMIAFLEGKRMPGLEPLYT